MSNRRNGINEHQRMLQRVPEWMRDMLTDIHRPGDTSKTGRVFWRNLIGLRCLAALQFKYAMKQLTERP